MAASSQRLMDQGEQLYEQYGKPLEQEHWGEYIAIFSDDRLVLGRDRLEVLDQALAQFGPGSFRAKRLWEDGGESLEQCRLLALAREDKSNDQRQGAIAYP
jgi:hypothetical protein